MKKIIFLNILFTVITSSMAMQQLETAGKSDEAGCIVINEKLMIRGIKKYTIGIVDPLFLAGRWNNIHFKKGEKLVSIAISNYGDSNGCFFGGHATLPPFPCILPLELFQQKSVGKFLEFYTEDKQYTLRVRIKNKDLLECKE